MSKEAVLAKRDFNRNLYIYARLESIKVLCNGIYNEILLLNNRDFDVTELHKLNDDIFHLMSDQIKMVAIQLGDSLNEKS